MQALTFFPDKTVIAIVRVVGISQAAVGVFEFQEFVAVLARVPSTGRFKVREGLRSL